MCVCVCVCVCVCAHAYLYIHIFRYSCMTISLCYVKLKNSICILHQEYLVQTQITGWNRKLSALQGSGLNQLLTAVIGRYQFRAMYQNYDRNIPKHVSLNNISSSLKRCKLSYASIFYLYIGLVGILQRTQRIIIMKSTQYMHEICIQYKHL